MVSQLHQLLLVWTKKKKTKQRGAQSVLLCPVSTCPPPPIPSPALATPNPVRGVPLCLVLTLNVEDSKLVSAQPPIYETVQIRTPMNPCKLT